MKPIDSHVLTAIVKSMLKIQRTENKFKIALKEAEHANESK